MFVTLAVHHPRREHRDDMMGFMKLVERRLEGAPGLVSLESFRDLDSSRLVAIGRWESARAAAAGLPKLLAIGGRRDEWCEAPDTLLQLVRE